MLTCPVRFRPDDRNVACQIIMVGSSCCAPCCSAGVRAAGQNGHFPPHTSAHYSYTNALHKSLIFIETMRSGTLPRLRVAWYES